MALVRGPGGGILRRPDGAIARGTNCCCGGGGGGTCCALLPNTLAGTISSELCPDLNSVLSFSKEPNPDYDPEAQCPYRTAFRWKATATICEVVWEFLFYCCGSEGADNPGSRCGDYWLAINGPACTISALGWLIPSQADNISSDECLACCGSWWEFGGDFTECTCCGEVQANFFVEVNPCN